MRSFAIVSLGLSVGIFFLFLWIPVGLVLLNLEQPAFTYVGITFSIASTAISAKAISAHVLAAPPRKVKRLAFCGAVAVLLSIPLYGLGIIH